MTETRTYCDRCHKELIGPFISQIRVLDYDNGTDFVSYDICSSCMRTFRNYMAKKILSYSDITKED